MPRVHLPRGTQSTTSATSGTALALPATHTVNEYVIIAPCFTICSGTLGPHAEISTTLSLALPVLPLKAFVFGVYVAVSVTLPEPVTAIVNRARTCAGGG